MPEPRLRPVADHDRPFLVDLYGSVREPELVHVPWDDETKRAFVEQQFAAQDAHYRRHYPGATLDVVVVDGEPAGRLYVHRSRCDIRIMDIALARTHRGRGIGTRLLAALIEEADASGRRLYERLGFQPAGEHGVYLRMERPAR